MALFKKKADPISDRARALSEEIAALEAKIKKLDTQLQHSPEQPRLRSTALPQRSAPSPSLEPAAAPALKPREPIFEEVDLDRLKARGEAPGTPEHYNELGVRKYDLLALLRRFRNQFSGPSTTNP